MKEKTKIGKLLQKAGKGLLKGVVGEIPIVGGMVADMTEASPDSPKGQVNWGRLIWRVVVWVSIVYLVSKGIVDVEFLQDIAQ